MEFNPESYRPLPLGLTIKKSKIDGLGLFTTVDLCAGEKLGMVKEKIKGSHFNFRRILYTVKPIKAGDEITSYYTLLK